MKKIFSIILVVVSIQSFAQFPNSQGFGTATTLTNFNGAGRAHRGLINGVFTDTTAANSDHIDFYNGAQIYTRSDRNFWLRDSVLNMWIRMAKYSETYTTLSQFIDETAWRTFYSNGSGDVTPLAFGTSGQVLTSNGVSSAPTWQTVSGANIYNTDGTLTANPRTLSLNTGILNIQQDANNKSYFAPSTVGYSYSNGTKTAAHTASNAGDILLTVYDTDEMGIATGMQLTDTAVIGFADAGGKFSKVVGKEDSLIFRQEDGNYKFPNIKAGVGTKSVRVDALGNITYADTTVGGGGGMTNPMEDVGDMIYGGASGDPTRLPPGGEGEVLTMTGGVPSWEPANTYNVSSQFNYQYFFDISGSTNANLYLAQSGTGAANTRVMPAPADNWFGGLELTTGTTSTGFVYFHFGNSGVIAGINIHNSYRYNYGGKVRFEDLSDGTETYHFMHGFSDANNNDASTVDGAWFSYTHSASSGVFVCNTRSNSVSSTASSGITVAADTDYDLEISVFGGSAYFYINKVLVATIATNVPTGSARATSTATAIRKSNGTTARKMYVEYLAYGKMNF